MKRSWYEQAVRKFPGAPLKAWKWLHTHHGIETLPANETSINHDVSGGISFSDIRYPAGFRELKDPPPFLFMRGQLPKKKPMVAIVGPREADTYGKTMAFQLARSLSMVGVGIVSGGALGIDRAAHEGALSVGGTTVCIQAGGLNKPTPQKNKRLFEEIEESEGALLSEIPSGVQIHRHFFLRRNRLIAALARVVIVVSARKKSGSLSTARWAQQLNRPVYAIPGDLNFGLSEGGNHLIARGEATLLHHPQQILDVLGDFSQGSCQWPPSREHRRLGLGPDWLLSQRAEGRESPTPRFSSTQSNVHRTIVKFLGEGSRSVEEISSYLDLSAGVCVSHLEMMVMQGKLVRIPGNLYGLMP